MPLDARKVAHILSNRDKIRAGRTETVTLVSVSGAAISYTAVAGVVFQEAGAVPAGISTRSGDITRTAYDAFAEFPSGTTFPADLRVLARTATASQAGVAAADRFTVLDRRHVGLGTRGSGGATNAGDRWVLRLRRLR